MTNIDWSYRGAKFVPDENFDPTKVYGFVYLITNIETGRKYVGKKFFWSKKTKIAKGKKKRLLVESDWREYWGSSEELKADVPPVDFNPARYLELNESVAEAGVDPTYHFMTHGRFEGRKYK